MTAPDLLNLTSVLLKTAVLAVTTSAQAIVSGESDKVKIVQSLYVANVDGTNNADITVDHYRSSTARHIAKTVVVPADSTIALLTGGPIYLEEGDTLRLTANANSDLEAVASYVEMS